MGKKKFAAATIVAMVSCALALGLVGCGGTDGGAKSAGGNIKTASEPVSASQAFNTESIWFGSSHDPVKQQEIDSILHFDGKGNVTRYSITYDITYADLKGLSNDEVLNLAKKQDKAYFDERRGELLDLCKEYSSIVREEGQLGTRGGVNETIDGVNKTIDALTNLSYQEPKAMPFKLHVETDTTGNNTSRETLVVPYAEAFTALASEDSYDHNHNPNMGTYVDAEKEFRFKSDESIGMLTVYDKTFSGFSRLYTIVDEGHLGFKLDTPDTKGVEVD